MPAQGRHRLQRPVLLRSPALALPFVLLAALLFGACGAATVPDPAGGGGGATPAEDGEDRAGGDAAAAATAAHGDATAEPADAAQSVDAGPEDIAEGPAEVPEFVLGINVTGTNQPEFFDPLPEGGELNVELGPQGLWMVVLAFKTRHLLEPPVQIITSIHVDGVQQGKLGLAKQKLQYGGDGYDYFYNLYLVVDDPSVAGQAGQVEIEVQDDQGGYVLETREVVLTGGE